MVGPQEAGSLPLLPDCPWPLLRPQPHGREKVVKLWASPGCCHCLSWSACFKNSFTKHVRLLFVSAVVRDGECVCSGITVAAPSLRASCHGPVRTVYDQWPAGHPEGTDRVCRLLRRSSHLSGRGQWEGRTSRSVAGEEGRGDADRGQNHWEPGEAEGVGKRSWLVW